MVTGGDKFPDSVLSEQKSKDGVKWLIYKWIIKLFIGNIILPNTLLEIILNCQIRTKVYCKNGHNFLLLPWSTYRAMQLKSYSHYEVEFVTHSLNVAWFCDLFWPKVLEKGMATHSRGLENFMDRGAWWATVHGVPSVGHDWMTNTFASRKFQDTLCVPSLP